MQQSYVELENLVPKHSRNLAQEHRDVVCNALSNCGPHVRPNEQRPNRHTVGKIGVSVGCLALGVKMGDLDAVEVTGPISQCLN